MKTARVRRGVACSGETRLATAGRPGGDMGQIRHAQLDGWAKSVLAHRGVVVIAWALLFGVAVGLA